MPKPLATAAIIMIALASGACSSTDRRPAPLPAAGQPLPPAGSSTLGGQPGASVAAQAGSVAPLGGTGGSCNASAAGSVVGQLATSVAADEAKQATGAEEVRILFPNQPITQEFIPGRLNLETNDENRITSVRCG
ncbi:I78 family peptidase inhibitor [Jiella pelagia]|uniref:I78 family peptidase inhibitor n=1 Tax=Jiella pelagia TaxID=2986949 RepID=A0ABY7BVI8_9HYPH|nr:I78 family peptidase inhibitor [Jiella pelagia]WAP67065.1 I78 family peptidase inhibitor [Jiella pelagia]